VLLARSGLIKEVTITVNILVLGDSDDYYISKLLSKKIRSGNLPKRISL